MSDELAAAYALIIALCILVIVNILKEVKP
jgi:hypothetical protein